MAQSTRPAPAPALSVTEAGSARAGWARGLDVLLVVLLLGLTFLLGVFPLRDTDFWWHLRTGDLIRQGAGIPRTDWYTFGAVGRTWIDLHWGFEVLLSLGHELGGIRLLNLAKCVITCAAVGLLVTTRRAGWPVWVVVMAWLPPLLLLGGRMYVRPETLTLLYLAIFLAVLFRWQQRPGLAYVLPVVQVAWVNTQGLFVLGPAVIGFALIEGVVQGGTHTADRKRWWRKVGPAVVLTGAACLVNPYGLKGALFPLELAGTMGNPIFARTIGELKPVLPVLGGRGHSFVEDVGFDSLPLQLHLACLVLLGLSFVVPLLGSGYLRMKDAVTRSPVAETKSTRSSRRKPAQDEPAPPAAPAWRLSLFRLLLAAAFGLLSVKGTRNSHQFAAVAGSVISWNAAEWLAALRQRRERAGGDTTRGQAIGRLAAFLGVGLTLVAVGTGRFYAWTGEGRTIGLGEEPLWFPHAAVRKAGEPGMPDRFVCFHNGHSALYEYVNGPARKVYTDARLEVTGVDLYTQYIELENLIQARAPGWEEALRRLGEPGVLVDNVHTGFSPLSATLMGDSRWACVWLDAVASVFVPSNSTAADRAMDFAALHFADTRTGEALTPPAIRGEARAAYEIAAMMNERGERERSRDLILRAIGQAGKLAASPAAEGADWRLLGLLEAIRDPVGSPERPVTRFRLPWDPLFDLSAVRAIHALRKALETRPEDVKVLLSLARLLESRGLDEEALPVYERLAVLAPPNQTRSITAAVQGLAAQQALLLRQRLGAVPGTEWNNADDLARIVDERLARGRARSAVELLERAYPERARSWPVADRIATLWLNLGEPERAFEGWRKAVEPPRPALARARMAAARYAANDLSGARSLYLEAVKLEPNAFEASFGLASVARDQGDAAAAVAASRAAVRSAPSPDAERAARAILDLASPYLPIAGRGGP